MYRQPWGNIHHIALLSDQKFCNLVQNLGNNHCRLRETHLGMSLVWSSNGIPYSFSPLSMLLCTDITMRHSYTISYSSPSASQLASLAPPSGSGIPTSLLCVTTGSPCRSLHFDNFSSPSCLHTLVQRCPWINCKIPSRP